MEVSAQLHLAVEDDTQVGAARRIAASLAARCKLDDTEAGRVALIVNELGRNLRKHAGRGDLFLRAMAQQGYAGVEVLTIDRGPGMDVDVALRDGHSTAGARGEGLGAVSRVADEFDAWSQAGQGSAVVARVWAGGKPELALQVGGVSQPFPGEQECGDGWTLTSQRARHRLLVVDGLGHGSRAARAAQTATQLFDAAADLALSTEQLAHDLHNGLRSTRGAALLIVEIDLVSRQTRFCGIGNVAASILERPGQSRGLVSHSGIAGHEARRVQELMVPLPSRAVLVAHSDGLASQWRVEQYPGLQQRHPSLIAGILFRDFRRKTDDSTVVVIKEP
jgi:anti-sigma regulatory factor (Ser/Thr protein kinase)